MTVVRLESDNRRRSVVTPAEAIALSLFLALVVLAFCAYHEWKKQTALLELMVVPVNNWDAVCDDFEINTARPIDGTPCGEFLKALVEINSAI
jgi:ABC-type uncharacterized transport system permease subunit